MEESRGVYRILMRKLERRRSLGRPRRRWEDDIKMDIREVEWDVVGKDWIDLSQDSVR